MEFGVQHKKTDPFRLVLSEVKMIVQIERTAHRTAHEEADVNIVKHLSESITSDVFVLLLHYYLEYHLTCNVVMLGTSYDRKVVDIGTTARKHTSFNILSGCDMVAQMFGISKAKSIKLLDDGHHLPYLGDSKADIKYVFVGATEFIMGACYGSQNKDNMSDVQREVFINKKKWQILRQHHNLNPSHQRQQHLMKL